MPPKTILSTVTQEDEIFHYNQLQRDASVIKLGGMQNGNPSSSWRLSERQSARGIYALKSYHVELDIRASLSCESKYWPSI
jgi:hypothetical protein